MSPNTDEASLVNRQLGWLTRQLQPLQTRWTALAGRERRLVGLAVGVLLLFLVWMLAVQPAWRTLGSAPAQMDALDAQWQTMQRLALDARTLRATPPVSPEQSAAALKAATERLGDKGRLALQGERAVLTVTGASPAQLRDWLAEARSGARARPLEATLQRSAAGFSGTLVVALVVAGSAP
jgi:general secretion pathway protein M